MIKAVAVLLLLAVGIGCCRRRVEPVVWFQDLQLAAFDEKATEVLARCRRGDAFYEMVHRDWLNWRAVSAGIEKGDAETLYGKVLYGVNELERNCKREASR